MKKLFMLASLALISLAIGIGCSSPAEQGFLWLQHMAETLQEEEFYIENAQIILTHGEAELQEKIAEIDDGGGSSEAMSLGLTLLENETKQQRKSLLNKIAVHNEKVALYNERALGFNWNAFRERDNVPPRSFAPIR